MGVKVSVLALSTIDLGSSPCRVKPKTINLVFAAFLYQGARANTGWHGIRIMCPSEATCLPADCCFSELAL